MAPKNTVVFFNIGAYLGETTDLIIGLCKKYDLNYKVYQFEPVKKFVEGLKAKYKGNERINTYPFALTNKNKDVPLYVSSRPDGNSLYMKKWNVDPNNYEMVEGRVFSQWFNENVKTKNPNEIWIMKSSINGSEWEFFKDLIDSEINKLFDIYCGKIFGNVQKTGTHTEEQQKAFIKFLKDNGIEEISLTCYNMENISEVEAVLLGKIKASGSSKVQVKPKVHVVDEDVIQDPPDFEDIESVIAKMPEVSVKVKRKSSKKKIKEIKR